MHYVMIGNGVAGITAALKIRERDRHARISVIGGESDYFFSRTALMYAFMDRMNPRDLEPYERKSYDAQRIERIRGWAAGLDANRKIVRLDDGREIAYDRLLLAGGSVPNRAPWAGLDTVRDGVVQFVSLQNLADCERLTPSTRQAVVAGGGLIGVELVECLVHHGVEVDFLVRDSWYWPVALNREEGAIVSDHIRHCGVRLHLEQEVDRVTAGADGRVSSVRTNKGVEFPCQLLGTCIGVRPAIDWLKSGAPGLALGRGIKVADDFRASLPDVWAAGDCAEFTRPDGGSLLEQIWYSAKRQGESAARAMLGDTAAYRPPLFYNSAKFFEIEYTTVGEVTRAPAGATTFFHRVPGKDASIRIVENEGAVVGVNLLGSRWNHKWFEKWIAERRSMAHVVANLHLAQFDVEFGRLALESVRAAFQSAERRAA